MVCCDAEPPDSLVLAEGLDGLPSAVAVCCDAERVVPLAFADVAADDSDGFDFDVVVSGFCGAVAVRAAGVSARPAVLPVDVWFGGVLFGDDRPVADRLVDVWLVGSCADSVPADTRLVGDRGADGVVVDRFGAEVFEVFGVVAGSDNAVVLLPPACCTPSAMAASSGAAVRGDVFEFVALVPGFCGAVEGGGVADAIACESVLSADVCGLVDIRPVGLCADGALTVARVTGETVAAESAGAAVFEASGAVVEFGDVIVVCVGAVDGVAGWPCRSAMAACTPCLLAATRSAISLIGLIGGTRWNGVGTPGLMLRLYPVSMSTRNAGDTRSTAGVTRREVPVAFPRSISGMSSGKVLAGTVT